VLAPSRLEAGRGTLDATHGERLIDHASLIEMLHVLVRLAGSCRVVVVKACKMKERPTLICHVLEETKEPELLFGQAPIARHVEDVTTMSAGRAALV